MWFFKEIFQIYIGKYLCLGSLYLKAWFSIFDVQCWQVDRECPSHLVITAHHCTAETGQKQVDINLTIFKTDYPGRKISKTYLIKTYNLNIETQENLHFYGIILIDCSPLYFIFNYFCFAFIAIFSFQCTHMTKLSITKRFLAENLLKQYGLRILNLGTEIG